MWPLHISWIIFTLVTTSNTQIRAFYVHLTSPQQYVKYTDFSKSKFRSYDPRRYTPEHSHISYHSYFLMCTIRTYIIHKLFINSCNCRTTQCFTSVWNIFLYTRYMHISIHKLFLTDAIVALHSAFMCITLHHST